MGQLLGLLTAPPGNLIFHLVLVFSVAGALQLSILHWRSSHFPQAARATLGLGMLLIGQLLLFILGTLTVSLSDVSAVLPIADRAVAAFSIIWISWLWAFPEPSRAGDAAAGLFSALVVAALGLSVLIGLPRAEFLTYNGTLGDRLWQLGSILLAVAGGTVLSLRRPDGYWNGITLLGILAVGHLGHLAFSEPGDYSGLLRLGYLAAFPILLTLPLRFPSSERAQKAPVGETETRTRERRRYSTDQKTLRSLLALATKSDTSKLPADITRAVGQVMLADLCFLILAGERSGEAMSANGYDLIREEYLQGGSLKKSRIPMISGAIERGRPLRLPASSTSEDLKGLSELLGLEKAGSMLCVPLPLIVNERLGAVMLLSPYSERTWTAEDQRFLSSIAGEVAPLLHRAMEAEAGDAVGPGGGARIAELEQRNSDLMLQLESARGQILEPGESPPDVSSLVIALEETQQTVERLQAENEMLRQREPERSAPPRDPTIELELRNALQDVAHLQNQLAKANERALQLERASLGPPPASGDSTLLFTGELQSIVSTILGYTDLLLGESVGILGSLQRKFIDRIRASTQQLGDLIESSGKERPQSAVASAPAAQIVDLNAIIDSAMSATSSQVREKNISMHIDLPKKVPPVKVAEAALEQILIDLLENAGAVTPPEGAITIAVETRQEDGAPFVLIQITDAGGGIPTEDLPRVFELVTDANTPPVRGVGDSGAVLSNARQLTKEQGGRIWVDSDPGTGSTFSILLPVGGSEAGSQPAELAF